jgi:hypothetical protein
MSDSKLHLLLVIDVSRIVVDAFDCDITNRESRADLLVRIDEIDPVVTVIVNADCWTRHAVVYSDTRLTKNQSC